MSEVAETEEQILRAAKQVFQRQGFSGARMQAIADEAGINKSMLHYYFRSKDKLFHTVFQQSIREFFPKIFEVLSGEMELEAKITKLVETYYTMFRNHPHLPRFVIHEMNQHPQRFQAFMEDSGMKIPERLINQIQKEVDAGRIKKIDPRQFIINTIGLCVFPLIAKPMVETVFSMDDEEFDDFLESRKKELPGFILNAIKK
ncbi:MAG: TetR/AcrR family transcriptional regulator [Balneolaceae bacterium]|nr:TetR/AcrR family transcriptional regulator [Balneolaceae bacterium]